MNKVILLSTLLCGTSIGCAAPLPPAQGRTDLALGKKVLFSPAPNDAGTQKGGTDATELTDGKISEQKNGRLWYESTSVGWSYPGRFNLAVDLGQNCDIDEIAIRLQNGSVGGGGLFPGWVEAFVSNDGEHYVKVAEFSRWNKGDFQKFDIKQSKTVGDTWVDCLRFSHLKTHGRFVGLRIYGNAMAVSDELYVFGAPDANTTGNFDTPDDFTVMQPEVYFHKPYLELANNIPLPVPIGLNTPDTNGSDVMLKMDLPPGLQISGGKIGGIDVTSVKPKVLSDGWSEYIFSAKAAKADKVFGQIYMQASGWKDGQSGELRYQFSDANWQSPQMNLPVRAVNVPVAPRLKTIMASLGWWKGTDSGWPDELNAFYVLGMNTFPVFGKWMPQDANYPQWKILEQTRRDGFLISNIDSPLYEIIRNHKDAKEIYDQFADGSVGKKLCICYRGKYYQEMLQYFAGMMAKVKPDFASEDIEMWSGGPKDSRNCVRCQEDFKKSGLPTWEAWEEAKGKEIISDLTTAAQKSIKDAGGRPFQNGVYDFRPGKTYQQVFNFNQLYPQLLQRSEVSTYTSLQPGDLEFIGDEARKDRAQLPHSDVMPWNTPGDAGTFSGDDFMWSLLENYANGARGIWFWSSRMWDSEDLIAYNKVIRAIAPVEDIITNGDLVGTSATIEGAGRVSGMKLGSRMMLLVAIISAKMAAR